MENEGCTCDKQKIREFEEEIARLIERDSILRGEADKIIGPVRKEFMARMNQASTIEERRQINRERREAVKRLAAEHNLDIPPIMGRFYPDGPRICDSFGFRIQMPGECDACYAKYREYYNAAMAGMFS